MTTMASASSMVFSSTLTQKTIFGTQLKNAPILGYPRSSKALTPIASAPKDPVTEAWREFKKSRRSEIPFVPLDQRWMFTLEEATGPDIWNTTWYPKAAHHVNTDKTWYVVDAEDLILGRLASIIAVHIRGKNLATFTPSVDMGSFVIVVNAEKVAVSGKKRLQKLYRRHSGRPGGLKEETFDQLQKRIPERIIEHAVRGMLPKGRLGRYLFNHLKVYKGPEHPHQAQQPIALPLRDKRIRVEK